MDTIENEITQKLKDYAKSINIDIFGIAGVDKLNERGRHGRRPQDIYPGCEAIIVFGIGILDTYSKVFNASLNPKIKDDQKNCLPAILLKLQTAKLRSYIRKKGYHSLDNTSSPLACGINEVRAFQQAGLGYVGESGNAISEKYGPRMVLGVILTNAPLILDLPFNENKCGECQICKTFCISKNIIGEGYSNPTNCVASTGNPDNQLLFSLNGYYICDMCHRKCPQGRFKFSSEECQGTWWDIMDRHERIPIAQYSTRRLSKGSSNLDEK